MGIWLFDANELQSLYQLILSQRNNSGVANTNRNLKNSTTSSSVANISITSNAVTSTNRKSISLNELLSKPVKNTSSLEEQLRTEFAKHAFGDLKEFARAVARFITFNPSAVATLFEELRK